MNKDYYIIIIIRLTPGRFWDTLAVAAQAFLADLLIEKWTVFEEFTEVGLSGEGHPAAVRLGLAELQAGELVICDLSCYVITASAGPGLETFLIFSSWEICGKKFLSL